VTNQLCRKSGIISQKSLYSFAGKVNTRDFSALYIIYG